MNTVSLNHLWSYLQGLSLSASNQRWLGERLIKASESHSATFEEDAKLEKLNALFGVWADTPDGEKIERSIMEARNAGYERELESMDE
ncbi:MAG: hypothetical protein IJV09_07985 [Prevotella sp.]|nr:hypothetical protein [Prevotella sp.]